MADSSPADQAAKKTQNRAFTAKEIEFLKGVVAGKSKVQAAMDAYPSQGYKAASVTAAKNLEKPRLKQALQQAYEAAGITPQSIADVLSDAMLAKKTFQVDGKLVESEHPDHGVRIGAARTAAQLIQDKDPGAGEKSVINFNIGTKNYVNTDPK